MKLEKIPGICSKDIYKRSGTNCLLDSVILVDVIRTKGEKLYAYAYKKPSAIQLFTLRAQSNETGTEIIEMKAIKTNCTISATNTSN